MTRLFKALSLVSVFISFFGSIQLMAADGSAAHSADIVGADGKKVGEVTFKAAGSGVEFHVMVSGLTPGKHGIHIHASGKCDGPDFKSAGGHYSMEGQHHGLENPQGPHWGDLPNLVVGANGKAHAHFVNKAVTLGDGAGSLSKTGGTSLVIHAGSDDEKSDPSGNSGDRVACAVLFQ